ncbi:ABC transporter ATP-binding protein [Microbacterium sp. NPDC057407]|uniref:ABC transporter ATP-binding protein n=1 Tax=Microbacterium sp. NPDC057407 TaxID=3346120 RepID=UPI00366E3926
MTASLPLPDDDPDESDRHESGAVVPLPSSPKAPAPKPRPPRKAPAKKPATSAAASAASRDSATKTPAKKRPAGQGAKPKAPSQRPVPSAAPEAPAPDPGPPPPLPVDLEAPVAPDPVEVPVPDLVIPPKPPLPEEPPAAPAPAEETAEKALALETVTEDAPETAAVTDALPAPAAAGDVLVMRGVSKRFGDTHAVDGIDLTVPAGTFYGLVGPNGAGKTTTLSMIAGLLVPDRGSISVGGVDAASEPVAAKRLMGVLPDRLRTFDRLTGRQLLYYYGVLRGLAPAVVESRTADLARAFDLTDALGRAVSDYSAGMVKKVMLAGALIHSPRLLVLDEPFEAVDPVSSAIILDILSTYVAHGGTVILSSHGMELVERVCSRVAVIVAGQVLAEGTIDEVRGELSLEQRFVELAGGLSDVEGLEWLHTFSD